MNEIDDLSLDKALEKDEEDLELETSSESEEDEEENESIRALIQYRLLYEQRKEAEEGRFWIRSESMWSLAIENLSTALRILAPTALLSIFYGYDSLLFRILQQCDRAVRSVLFNNKEQEDNILKWLQETFPEDKRAKSLDAVWANGSLVCELVESVIPGSCPGHDKQCDLSHGQRLAEQYLGVAPIFSKEDLSHKALTTYQECRLTHYLNSIKEALHRLSPPVSRTGSPILNMHAYTLDYVARGMGLMTASKNRRATFYLYPTAQQGIEPGEISIQIKGPGNSYGSILVPVILGKTHIMRNVFYNLGHRQSLDKMHLPIVKTSSTSYAISSEIYAKKLSNDIEVNLLIRSDKVKVAYVPKEIGYHELSLISKGCHIMGSPFRINVEHENVQRSESRDYEDDIKVEPHRTDRKIVLRIVDFVTEKMVLTENGTLEKISNEEAKVLIQRADSSQSNYDSQYSLNGPDLIDKNMLIQEDVCESFKSKSQFNDAVKKIMLMLKICKEMKQRSMEKDEKRNISTPDIVNSTRREENCAKTADYLRNVYKNKPDSFYKTNEHNDEQEVTKNDIINIVITSFDDDIIEENVDIPILDMLPERPKTPVLKILNEEIYEEPQTQHYNGFDDIIEENVDIPTLVMLPERPKTPVLKILNEEMYEEPQTQHYNGFDINNYEGQFDSLTEIQNETSESLPQNAETQPPSIDFHIGEPVTPTCMMAMANLDGDIDSIILASNLEKALSKFDSKIQKTIKDYEQYDESNPSLFTTPLRQTPFEQMTDNEILQMYEGSITEEPQKMNTPEQPVAKVSITTTRENGDTWDSAYMSIDEVNNSPENNPNSPLSTKPKLFVIEENENDKEICDEVDSETYSKMGPAEKEFWTSITNEIPAEDINEPNPNDDSASDLKADVKRSPQPKPDSPISLIQTPDAESVGNHHQSVTVTPTKKAISKMVSEKKEYWDDMIKTIVESEEQTRKILKKTTTHNLRRNDSLSRKREQSRVPYAEARKKYNTQPINGFEPTAASEDSDSMVARWKKYWNERIDSNSSHFRKELAKTRKYLTSPDDETKQTSSCDNLTTFLEESAAPDSPCASKSYGDKKYRVKSMSMSNLSERIDKFLDTVSNYSDVEDSRFSTPEKTPIEKNPTPERIDSDNVESKESNTPQDYAVDIKSKIETYNENVHDKSRRSFLLKRSKTIDIPRQLSFVKLKKYFSLETIESPSNEPMRPFSSLTENPPVDLNKENSASTDSIPTLSETKARIEKHLISMQNKIKTQSNIENLKNETKKDQMNHNNLKKDIEVCRENDMTIKDEIRSIKKPIGSIVAVFENQSATKITVKLEKNKISPFVSNPSVAENQEGTAELECQKSAPKQETKINNESDKNSESPKKNESETEEPDEADKEIRSQNYKTRFQKARAFFQTLEPTPPEKNARKLNECEKLLLNLSLTNNTNGNINPETNKRRSCEMFTPGYVWRRSKSERLIKISEKFHVQNLFRDVAGETDKTRMGIFKGIPHKNAVLAAFQSMENINQQSSYEYTESQMKDMVKIGGILKPQTYHPEYPYIPMTDPSKYRSRRDITAMGLILRKDLLKLQKLRRNSAPSRTVFHCSIDNINL